MYLRVGYVGGGDSIGVVLEPSREERTETERMVWRDIGDGIRGMGPTSSALDQWERDEE